ncbi:hypothetical protein LTR97_006402 [Elasticomyces elasticus]|uniref:Uncharacterized protein n=1 Tax=Elasticomyces elasticus TaxID=574655 RepID=A0AAN7ZN72_9PEZI|nr:hypothetical protein LTR97_006402 [Elasticomyces elasticus]
MRLLNVKTRELVNFTDPPLYAVLSHRWSGDELSYDDYCLVLQARRRLPITPGQALDATTTELQSRVLEITNTVGYRKIEGFCKFAREDHQTWVYDIIIGGKQDVMFDYVSTDLANA